MLPTKLNPLGVNPYDGVMEFEKAGNLWIKAQEFIADTVNNLYVPSGAGESGFTQWNISQHGTYTLSADITQYEDDNVALSFLTITALYSDGTRDYTQTKYSALDGNTYRYSVSHTTNTSKELTALKFNLFDYSGYVSRNIKAENIMLSLRGKTEYEPYNPDIYRCYGESTQYQNDGRNLLPLPDDEVTFSRGEGQHMTWTIKDNKIKMVGDVTQATTYSSICKLTNGYVSQFSTSSVLSEYFLPAGTYTMSIQNWSGYTSSSSYPYLRLVNTAGKTFQVGWNNEKGYTFTSEEPIAFAYLFANKIEIDCEFNIQIEAGSTKTEWKPYTTNPTPTVNNPSPIISNYPKGRYKTNLEGITIKLDDDLRGIDEYKDYVEVNVATKEKSITRNVKKTNSTDKGLVFEYYPGVNNENPAIQQLLIRDINNKWSEALNTYKSYSNRFHYRAWTHEINFFYISRRTMDTLLQCYIPAEDLDSADIAGVKKFFTDYPTEFIYPLSNPITTLL